MSQPTNSPEGDALDRAITIDDLKHRAYGVRDQAVLDTKQAYQRAIGDDVVRAVVIGVVAVAALASIAYYMGTRSGRSVPADPWE